ncbi:hypothetical protein EGR_06807 [Echinococcus granulosus]|uniref:Uncharacterized protein n=1 Tax=Echinococcus granulosus TaxID=6210 RepID=W6UB12_ECHGR|nr:hypothetical protein EGR_06807 [Echinococcus granulosus]EUB58280.1 hypothetical protein EGR_06807 [Echinococcus granulosus]
MLELFISILHQQRRQKRSDSVASYNLASHVAKKSKLADVLLDGVEKLGETSFPSSAGTLAIFTTLFQFKSRLSCPTNTSTRPNSAIESYSVRLVSNFDIPDVNKNSTIRRAEYSRRTDAVRHSLDVRHNRSHQQSLYEFALVTCLGVNSNASSSSLLLDLACGAFLPFGGYSLTAKLPFKLGLDQLVRPIPGIDFARCSLWVTANGDPGVISLFAQECVRVLASRGGAAVFQFYPGNKGDLDAICEALADAHHCVHGCRLSARPVENRGIKIFVYCVRRNFCGIWARQLGNKFKSCNFNDLSLPLQRLSLPRSYYCHEWVWMARNLNRDEVSCHIWQQIQRIDTLDPEDDMGWTLRFCINIYAAVLDMFARILRHTAEQLSVLALYHPAGRLL